MSRDDAPRWKFLTNHAHVLICIARDPGVRLREISERVGITERAAHRIVDELADGNYVKRERNGRRNSYTVQTAIPLPDRVGRVAVVGDLLAFLGDTNGAAPGAQAPPAVPSGKAREADSRSARRARPRKPLKEVTHVPTHVPQISHHDA